MVESGLIMVEGKWPWGKAIGMLSYKSGLPGVNLNLPGISDSNRLSVDENN